MALSFASLGTKVALVPALGRVRERLATKGFAMLEPVDVIQPLYFAIPKDYRGSLPRRTSRKDAVSFYDAIQPHRGRLAWFDRAIEGAGGYEP